MIDNMKIEMVDLQGLYVTIQNRASSTAIIFEASIPAKIIERVHKFRNMVQIKT